MLINDVHLSTARHLIARCGGKFSAAVWSAGDVPRITNDMRMLSDDAVTLKKLVGHVTRSRSRTNAKIENVEIIKLSNAFTSAI